MNYKYAGVPKLTVFDYHFNNEEVENEFNAFFTYQNLPALFNNEEKAGTIIVKLPDAQSIIKKDGAWKNDLIELSTILAIGQTNQSYEEAVFRIIREAKTFQGMMMKIRKLVQYVNTIPFDRLFNTWNIVWYNKDLK